MKNSTTQINPDKISSVQVKLPLFLWREDTQFVAFTPALDLSSCGSSEEEAVSNFSEAVELFFETAIERRVLEELLGNFGWRFEVNSWIPASQPIGDTRVFETLVPLPPKTPVC